MGLASLMGLGGGEGVGEGVLHLQVKVLMSLTKG